MKESEASNGQKLHALILSMMMRTSFATALKQFEPIPEGRPWEPWDSIVRDLIDFLQKRTRERLASYSNDS